MNGWYEGKPDKPAMYLVIDSVYWHYILATWNGTKWIVNNRLLNPSFVSYFRPLPPPPDKPK